MRSARAEEVSNIMRNTRTLILVELALAVALATVLNFLQIRLPINFAGGSVNLSMLPIAIVALRRGVLTGAVAGTMFGCIDLLLEPYILVPIQVLLDYPVPYLLFGAGVGLFSEVYRKAAVRDEHRVTGGSVAKSSVIIVVAGIVGGLLRFVSHVLSGVFFFAEYAVDFFTDNPNLLQAGPADMGINVWIYSIIYNFPYITLSLVAVLLCALVVMPVLAKAVPAHSVDKSE